MTGFVLRSLAIIAAGVLARAFFIMYSPFQAGDSGDYESIAANLIAGNGFAIWASSPTVTRAPLYPLFMAALYLGCGVDVRCMLIAQAFLGGVGAWLVYLLARRLVDETTAIVGSLAAAIYPHLAFYAGTILSENVVFFALALALLAIQALRQPGRGLGRALVTGVSLGALALTSPRFALFPLAALAVIALDRCGRRAFLIAAIGVAAGYVAVLAPWTWRNFVTFGVPTPFTVGSQGLAFWLAADRVGLYDYRFDELATGEPPLGRWISLYGAHAGEERAQIGERLQLEGELNRDALAKIAADPGAFLRHRLRVLPSLWFQPAAFAGHFRPPLERQNEGLQEMIGAGHFGDAMIRAISIVVFTGGLFVGAALGTWALRRRLRDVALLYAPAIYVTVMQAPFWIEHRYSVPAHPVLWIVAAAGIAWAWRTARQAVSAAGV